LSLDAFSRAFGGRAPPGHAGVGELQRSPDLLATIGGGVLLLREMQRKGEGEGKREGRERGGEGR